jgi:hypothetical protein
MKIAEKKLVYRDVFDCKGGEEIIKDLKNRYSYDSTTYSDDSTNQMIYKEGQRAVVLYLLNQIKVK